MKTLLIALFVLMVSGGVWGQVDSLLVESEQKIIKTDKNIDNLKEEIALLNQEVSNGRQNDSEQIRSLQVRMSKMEDLQNEIERRELEVYTYNYQAAVLQLIKLNSLLNNLDLYEKTKSFYEDINKIGNPLNDPKYESWKQRFNEYISAKKNQHPTLNVLQNFIHKDSSTIGMLINNIPYMNVLSEGISLFTQNYKKDKRIYKESSEILMLNVKLSSFNKEIEMINNSEALKVAIENYTGIYNAVLDENIERLGESKGRFTKPLYSAMEESEYMNTLKLKAAQYVENKRNDNIRNWKTEINTLLNSVQKINVDFAELALKVTNDLKAYQNIINKYKQDLDFKGRFNDAERSLENIISGFEKNFPINNKIDYSLYLTP
ncbi:hypothetical protein [Sphingobacterium yanglingense]|uniref:Uncharacterized protein n=1 Tax=Sphingobacterium yanglingense TaxID=1437280 RepID=A0A4V3DDI0_9SPHI|nr:hypothetical protein [Sphingobacterium yanglingense]TDQ76604.1 hypothetical protein CLV99_3197 [Sphingobacterium yanglingense]